MSALLEAALDYASRGRPVLPVAPDGSKRPLTAHAFKDASIVEERIRSWWRGWPDAWIGLATGDGWFVLDVDDRAALGALERKYGSLPATRRARTPRGGQHFYFQGDARVGNNVPVDGIDIRGYARTSDQLGGFVVAPPSPGYGWEHEGGLARAPRWLHGLLAEREQTRSAPGHRVQLELGDITDGRRNAELARIVGVLLGRDVDVDLVAWLTHAANQTYFKPPKPRAEVDKVVDSIAQAEARQRKERAR